MNYIDRTKFISDMCQYIDKIKFPCIVLLAGSSGIGKHSAVKKLMQEKISNQYNMVTLPSSMVNEETQKVKYEYFFKVIDRIQNDYCNFALKKSELSFTRFVKKKGLYKQMLAEEISSSLTPDFITKKGLAALFARMSINRYYNTGSYNCLKTLTERNAVSVTVGEKYVNHILSNDEVILELCAAQYMDTESIFSLCNSIKSKKGKGIIFLEYDIEYNHYSTYENFCELLRICCDEENLFIYPFSPLNFEDFYSVLCLKRDWNLSPYKTWIHKEYYQSQNKSINEFVDKLCVKWHAHSSSLNIISAEDYFPIATKFELYILCVLDIHGGHIKKETLYEYFDWKFLFSVETDEIETNIESLSQIYILNNSCEELSFSYQSVNEAWKKYINSLEVFPESILLAADGCFNYYRSKLSALEKKNNTSESKKIIHLLLGIITHYLPKRIIYISRYISLIASEFSTPEDVRYPILLLINELRKNKTAYIDIYYDIIELCCDIELYFEALQFWNDIQEIVLLADENECNKANYLFCKVHYLCDEHSKVIQFTKNKLEKIISPESILYYSIYLIISYRACNAYSQIENVVSNIKKHVDLYSTYIQYGLFLRISEVYMSRAEAILDVDRSVSFFLEHNRKEQAAKSQISLSFLYAINGRIQDARNSLLSAKKILNGRFQHILYNNEAAINMLSGIFDDLTESLLSQACICSNCIFSNIAIYNNQMIYYFETNQFDNMRSRAYMIENQLKKIIDKHLLAVVSYNLYVFLKNIVPSKSEYYYKIAYRYRKHCSTLNSRLLGELPHNEHEKWLLQKPWHIVMLSFWETDYI